MPTQNIEINGKIRDIQLISLHKMVSQHRLDYNKLNYLCIQFSNFFVITQIKSYIAVGKNHVAFQKQHFPRTADMFGIHMSHFRGKSAG